MPRKSSSNFRLLLVAVVALLCATVSLAGPITLTIYPNIQPNPTMSPDWAAFYTTAITAIGNDASSGGVGVSRYEVISEFYPGDVVSSSGFHSWRGLVPGVYANQHGNYLGFGLHVVGDGTQQFSLAGLSYAMSSNDVGSGCPAGTSGSWCRTGGYNTPDSFTTYNAYTMGLNYGIDRARGGGDNTLFRFSWKWRKRSPVKIMERTHEEATEALHAGRNGRHPQAASAGEGAHLEALR